MKLLLTILTLTISLSASATHWLTYYVYYETEYVQGPWTRADILEYSEYKYLASEAFEDLFGTVEADLVSKMLSRLKDKKPSTYDWDFDLTFQGDTVIITCNELIEELETVKNEISATLTLNGYEAITFRVAGNEQTWTIQDLTLPYIDLVTGQSETSEQKTEQDLTDNETQEPSNTESNLTQENEGNPLMKWLIASGILNFILIVLYTMKKRK